MEILNGIKKTRNKITEWKQQSLKIGFVPTMGALHAGHASLIEQARQTCDKVVVSIFVNPSQFGPNEDYNQYPRTLEKDSEVCEKYGADLIFAPAPVEMYPNLNFSRESFTTIIPPSNFTNKLCGESRPGHFEGVATVVVKLFNIVQPDFAFFGQKDAQQLAVIKKFCFDLNIPVKIIGCPIVRSTEGLALSSRNAYLSESSKIKALTLYKTIKKVEELYKSGHNDISSILDEALRNLHPDFELDYLKVVDLETMEFSDKIKENSLVAIAAKIDNVRLIDSLVLE